MTRPSAVSVERRLAKVEASLTPIELALRWLDEAHAFDDMDSYMRFLVETGRDVFPMDRLAREAEANARIRIRAKPGEDASAMVRRSVVEAMFLGQLVLRINTMSAEFLDREVLVQAALGAHFALASSLVELPDPGPLRWIATCRDLLVGRVNELHAFEIARARVESRYLGGTAADFPAAQRAWSEQRAASETMTVCALRIAELDGAEPGPLEDQAAFDARVNMLVGDFVEPARSKAYDELGDGRRALSLAIGWLRPKLLGEAAVPKPGDSLGTTPIL